MPLAGNSVSVSSGLFFDYGLNSGHIMPTHPRFPSLT